MKKLLLFSLFAAITYNAFAEKPQSPSFVQSLLDQAKSEIAAGSYRKAENTLNVALATAKSNRLAQTQDVYLMLVDLYVNNLQESPKALTYAKEAAEYAKTDRFRENSINWQVKINDIESSMASSQ